MTQLCYAQWHLTSARSGTGHCVTLYWRLKYTKMSDQRTTTLILQLQAAPVHFHMKEVQSKKKKKN